MIIQSGLKVIIVSRILKLVIYKYDMIW